MKKYMGGMVSLLLLSGCGMPFTDSASTPQRCQDVANDLVKVDSYIKSVEQNSAFHLEEAALAMGDPTISTSNEKDQMLKDANKRKASLLQKKQQMGCK